MVKSISIAADVAGRPLSASDFKVQDETVSGLTFSPAPADPHPLPQYKTFSNTRLPPGGAIDTDGVVVPSAEQCIKRCNSDWSCGCVVFTKSDFKCWKRRNCVPTTFINDVTKDVLCGLRQLLLQRFLRRLQQKLLHRILQMSRPLIHIESTGHVTKQQRSLLFCRQLCPHPTECKREN